MMAAPRSTACASCAGCAREAPLILAKRKSVCQWQAPFLR